MKYPEPPSTFGHLEVVDELANQQRIVFQSQINKARLEISYINEFGWVIEERSDLKDPSIVRQPFTGSDLQKNESKPAISELEDDRWTIKNSFDTTEILLSSKNGKFTLVNKQQIIFESHSIPFARFENSIDHYDNLRSPHFYEMIGTPACSWTTDTKTFSSSMTRFQFQRPTGPVLGFAGSTGELDRNGYRFELFNTDKSNHIPDRTPLYQSWPIVFFCSEDKTTWVGLFYDNPSRTFADLGEFFDDRAVFESVTGNSRIYLCAGATLSEVSTKMSKLLGTGSMPPAWALGYQQCRWSYMSTKEVEFVADKFNSLGLPLDCIYFDIDYMEGFRIFTVNSENFGDLRECLQKLLDKGIQSVFIVDPGVKVDKDYALYNDLVNKADTLKTKDQEPLEITCWPGKAVLPDFDSEKTKALWKSTMQDWLNKYPFSGIWNDMNEPANFERDNYIVANSYNHEGKKFESIYNLYGFQMAKASYEAMIQIRPDETPFSITRSGYPGVQKYCVIWHGDNHAWWEHLRLAINTCINYSLSGVYYTGADVPGFFQNAPDDLAVRFFQLGAFMPLFRGHSAIFAKYNEPYRFSESAFQAIKKAIYLRYSLAREWISNLDYCYTNAISPIMPVFRKSGALVQDQFLLFDKFLVAPVTTRGQEESLVYLPEGTWYRLGHPDSPIEGNKTITCEVDLTTIPVFVRAGSIVFVNVVGKNVEETLSKGEVRELYVDSQGEAKGIWSSASFEKNEISAKEVYFKNGQFI